MNKSQHFIFTPWDYRIFGMDTYEIPNATREVLQQAINTPGHFTVKVDPLFPKEILHEFGFYYCDTLIQPYSTPDRFIFHEHKAVSIASGITLGQLVQFCHGAYSYDRFHRDFNIKREYADLRYDAWLEQLFLAGNVFTFMFQDEPAGFLGFEANRVRLTALSAKYKGKSLAKYFLSAAFKKLFGLGYDEVTSSISAANIPNLNMYSSLGFKFRNPIDVYHRMVR